jgi:hypothetical protein
MHLPSAPAIRCLPAQLFCSFVADAMQLLDATPCEDDGHAFAAVYCRAKDVTVAVTAHDLAALGYALADCETDAERAKVRSLWESKHGEILSDEEIYQIV